MAGRPRNAAGLTAQGRGGSERGRGAWFARHRAGKGMELARTLLLLLGVLWLAVGILPPVSPGRLAAAAGRLTATATASASANPTAPASVAATATPADAGSSKTLPTGTPTQPLPQSSEALLGLSPWSRPASYPLALRPRSGLYVPSADWIGRLVLPGPAELADPAAPRGDWVWIELEQAPEARQELIGRRLRLRWAEDPALQRLVAAVTTEIRFGENARLAASQGNVVPQRLNGRAAVGPLQSLAGARPADDVIVRLEGLTLVPPESGSRALGATGAVAGLVGSGQAGSGQAGPEQAGPPLTGSGDAASPELRIARPPVQVSGRWQGLVRFEKPLAPGAEGELWRVRHFNRASGGFDGAEETIRVPQLPRNRYGRWMFDPSGLAASPLNREGWLIQGAPAADGLFTVQAIEPRLLLTPLPQRRIEGTTAGLAFLQRGSWSAPQLQRGTLHSTALVPDGVRPPPLQIGERALLMHLFGGIGGADGEPVVGWTATGHFAFGEAEVVEDRLSGEPRLAIRYHQIYANNPDGIVAGSQDWSAYGGNLQRGWLGTRPFSDLLIPVGGELLDAIALQAEILAARYRSGDGEGVALVTPATSCVQDSSQALWIALQQLRRPGSRGGPDAAEQMRLERLGRALSHLLTPFGRVRSDWAHNSALAQAERDGRFQASQRRRDVLLSWRSLLPRGAHDLFAAEALRAGLPLQVLRTNQIPGLDPRLEPIAPTTLLGQQPLLGTAVARLGDALVPPPLNGSRIWPLLILAVYAPVALLLGRRSGFLPPSGWQWPPLPQLLRRGGGYLLMPAFGEELVFRGLLLPQPIEGFGPAATLAWIALSTGLFVLYHPLAARLWYPQGRTLFADPRFLVQCTLLGLACGLAYVLSGSLWGAVLLHWLAVLLWLEPLQGRLRLRV